MEHLRYRLGCLLPCNLVTCLFLFEISIRSNMECYEDNLKGNAGFYNGMERDIANHNQGLEQSVLE